MDDLNEDAARERTRGVREELDHRVAADVPRELRLVSRLEERLVQVRGRPDRESGTERPDHLAHDNRLLAADAIRHDANRELEDEESDPERHVDQGEVEVGREVAANPECPERNPEREGGRCLVRVETTDAPAELGQNVSPRLKRTILNLLFRR